MRARPLCLASCWCSLLALTNAAPAHAYAWMIKHGFAKCGTCHVDPSGGETLTGMGRAQAEQLLSWSEHPLETPARVSQFLLGAVPEPAPLRLGGSYRHLLLYQAGEGGVPAELSQFPMQVDVYGAARLDYVVIGGNLGVARGIEGSAHARGAQLNREQGEGWLVLSRNHFLGVQIDEGTLLRLGRLNLPFGVRIPEHVAWVREATRTDRESDQQHGLALAHARGPLRLEVMLIAGNFQTYPDRYRERGYSLAVEYLLNPSFALGVSSLLARSNEDRFTQRQKAVRQAHGVTGRMGWAPHWALLAELDVLHGGGRELGYAGLIQAHYELQQGLHFLLTGEALDQGALKGSGPTSPGNGQPRVGGWASAAWYVYSHLELRLDAVQRQGSPFTVQAQLHLFL